MWQMPVGIRAKLNLQISFFWEGLVFHIGY